MGDWVTIGRESDLPAGRLRGVQLGDVWLAVGRLDDGTLVAFDEWCTHEECQLSEGDLDGDKVVCYCHGSAFDTRTGAALNPPATEPVGVYEIRELDGEVQLRFDAQPGEVRWTEWRL
jgi:3-phenylpropionate/trans-cinnamate dioxygenase ferredoxin subunit